jgi:hypothetical protein
VRQIYATATRETSSDAVGSSAAETAQTGGSRGRPVRSSSRNLQPSGPRRLARVTSATQGRQARSCSEVVDGDGVQHVRGNAEIPRATAERHTMGRWAGRSRLGAVMNTSRTQDGQVSRTRRDPVLVARRAAWTAPEGRGRSAHGSRERRRRPALARSGATRPRTGSAARLWQHGPRPQEPPRREVTDL